MFDSGIGGLTVLRALRRRWPGHSTLYLGDTARVPYGTKSRQTVVHYARQNTRLLLEEGIDLLVVACNTASAYALEELDELPTPVVGVIEPGAAAAARATTCAHVGVIGTAATIASGTYERAIRRLRPRMSWKGSSIGWNGDLNHCESTSCRRTGMARRTGSRRRGGSCRCTGRNEAP